MYGLYGQLKSDDSSHVDLDPDEERVVLDKLVRPQVLDDSETRKTWKGVKVNKNSSSAFHKEPNMPNHRFSMALFLHIAFVNRC